MSSNGMTHDEIWDDSALVNSWNQALDEYKKYHSIHVSGIKLEDSDLPEFRRDAKHETNGGEPVAAEPSDDVPVKNEGDLHKTTNTISSSSGIDATKHSTSLAGNGDGSEVTNGAATTGHASGGGAILPPQMLLGSVKDEGMKNLLMSWYYAGYYTGLHEGREDLQKQQARQ